MLGMKTVFPEVSENVSHCRPTRKDNYTNFGQIYVLGDSEWNYANGV